jgi:hypothetical protein
MSMALRQLSRARGNLTWVIVRVSVRVRLRLRVRVRVRVRVSGFRRFQAISGGFDFSAESTRVRVRVRARV